MRTFLDSRKGKSVGEGTVKGSSRRAVLQPKLEAKKERSGIKGQWRSLLGTRCHQKKTKPQKGGEESRSPGNILTSGGEVE